MKRFVACMIIVAAACSETPEAVSPAAFADHAHEPGEFDFPLPEGASRPAMLQTFEAGPTPYVAVECADTYDQIRPGGPDRPSLWVIQDDTAWLTEGPIEWLGKPFSADLTFEQISIVCTERKESRPEAGEAWAAFVYARELLADHWWFRPRRFPFEDFSGRAQYEIDHMHEDWTRESLERLVRLRPGYYFRSPKTKPWSSAETAAAQLGDEDLRVRVMLAGRPRPQCSRDEGPARHADRVESICLSSGNWRCVAELNGLWESSSDWPQPTRLNYDALPAIDRETYLAGLILHFPLSKGDDLVPELRVPQHFVSKTPGAEQRFRQRLMTIAKHPSSDALTRHRIALTLTRAFGEPLRLDADWVPLATRDAIERYAEKGHIDRSHLDWWF
jgi:hypothetical protein